MDNCTSVARNLLSILKVKHTKNFLEENILSHPEHPSLLSISDTLEKYNIESLPVKVDSKKIKELPLPFIVQLSDKGGMFHVLENHSETNFIYVTDNGKKEVLSNSTFLDRWTGICLLIGTNETSKEPGIEKTIWDDRLVLASFWATAILLLFWLIQNVPPSMFQKERFPLLIVYFFLKTFGLTVGAMLLWYEVDKYNPTIQKFCSGKKKTNCNAVLESKYAKLFNGHLSLGLLGFAYFFGSLLFILINGVFNTATLAPLAYLNFLALLVVPLSAYYQGVVIEQWCRFCIALQCLIVIEALTAFYGGFHKDTLMISEIALLLALMLFPIPMWKIIRPIFESAKEANLHKRNFAKFKNNPNVFFGLLSKARKVKHPINGLGISLTNNEAQYNIVKVCNPYCSPCAKAHLVLEELYKTKKVNLQILFTASANESDPKAKPVSHLLSIAEKGNLVDTQKALDDWYSAKKKDYEVFATRYPMNGELKEQEDRIKAMRDWCNLENITRTPTIFINGHELPREYRVEDLKEVF